jgi:DNA-binding response OmpR family regulator
MEFNPMAEKVLIVKDDPKLASLVEEYIRKAGHDVRSTTVGSYAFRLVDEWKPDLLLIEITSPGMGGFSIARQVREFSSIPIIILSTKGEEADILQGFEVGADDYIVKPFSSVELLARVRALLRRFHKSDLEHHGARYQQGDLIVDTEAGRVFKSGIEIELSVTQYKLLATMASSMGRILLSEELLGSVWGPGYKSSKSILWVAISRLKQKIEQDPKHPLHIITIPRVGYVMPREPGGSYDGKLIESNLANSEQGIDVRNNG